MTANRERKKRGLLLGLEADALICAPLFTIALTRKSTRQRKRKGAARENDRGKKTLGMSGREAQREAAERAVKKEE